MTETISQILVEVLKIFGIATKELKRGSTGKFSDRLLCVIRILTKLCVEKFLRRLAGMTDLEDALKKLDRLTQEEFQMADAQGPMLTEVAVLIPPLWTILALGYESLWARRQ